MAKINYDFRRDTLVIPDKYNTGTNNINMSEDEKAELTVYNRGDKITFKSLTEGVDDLKVTIPSDGGELKISFYNDFIAGSTFLLENADISCSGNITGTNQSRTSDITFIFKNCKLPAIDLSNLEGCIWQEYYNCECRGLPKFEIKARNVTVNNCGGRDGINPVRNVDIENIYFYDMLKTHDDGHHIDAIQAYGDDKVTAHDVRIYNFRSNMTSPQGEHTGSGYVNSPLMVTSEKSPDSTAYTNLSIQYGILSGGNYLYINHGNHVYSNAHIKHMVYTCNSIDAGNGSYFGWDSGNFPFYLDKETSLSSEVYNDITVEDCIMDRSIIVSSVYKKDGKVYVTYSNCSYTEQTMTVMTNKGSYDITVPAVPRTFATDETLMWSDLPSDLQLVIDDDGIEYVVCFENKKQIRFVNFTNKNVYISNSIIDDEIENYASYLYYMMVRRRLLLDYYNIPTNLPNYLIECDYVDSTGYSWIDTGYNTTSQNTSIECKVKGKNTSASEFGGYMYGVRPTTSGTTNCFLLYDNKTNYSARFSDGSAINFSTGASYNSAKGITVINQNKTCITMNFEDGTSVQKTWTVSDFTNNQNFYIGGCNVAGEISAAKSWHRWYYFKIWDNGTLVRYLIPIYNSTTQRFGFFDKVNGVEYYNTDNHDFTGTVPTSSSGSTSSGGSSSGSTSGGGTSSGGSSSIEVLPDGYTLVKAVKQAQGNYIDLGIKADYNTKIGVMHNLFVNNNNYYSMFGYQSGDNNRMMISNTIGVMNLYFLNKTITATLTPTSATTSDTVCTTYFDNSQFTLDLVNADGTTEHLETAITPTNTTGVTGENLFLGRASTSGGSAWSYGSTSGFTWYGCKIWQGSELVRYLAPCLDSSNVACFYDFVGKQTYYPVTGSFSYIAL